MPETTRTFKAVPEATSCGARWARLRSVARMASPWEGGDVEIEVPVELETGVYASLLTAWYTGDEFTLDFATLVEAPKEDARARGVSRIKVPPARIFLMIRSMHAKMAKYEERWGPIHYPEERREGP